MSNLREHANKKASERGAALIVTLAILTLVTALVVSLFLMATTERIESAASSNQSDAKRLASGVVDLVKSTVTQATAGYESGANDAPVKTARTAWASQPGLIRTWGQDGNPYKTYRLYSSGRIVNTGAIDLAAEQVEIASWKSGAPAGASYNALWCDLNAPAANQSGGLTYPVVTPPADTNSGSNSTAVDATNGIPTDKPWDPAISTLTDQEGVQGFAITSSPGFSTGNISASNNPAPMPVKWFYVLRDGTFVSPSGNSTVTLVPGATQTNPIVGRVAYWTDDETCKININTSSEGVYWDKPYGANREDSGLVGTLGYSLSVPVQDEFQRLPGHPAFTSLSAIYGGTGWLPRPDIGFSPTGTNGAAAYTGGSFAQNILPYFNLSPRIGDGGTQGGTRGVLSLAGNGIILDSSRLYATADEFVYGAAKSGGVRDFNNTNLSPGLVRKTTFFATANSKGPETTLLEQPRISMWPVQAADTARNAKDKLLAFASTAPVNLYPYFFQRVSVWQSDASPGTSQTTTDDASLARNQELLNYLLNSTSQAPGFGSHLSDKYTGGILPQILFSMFDTVRSAVNTTSRTLLPSYSFAPYGSQGSYSAPVGLASVVPARTTLGGTEVKGYGRFPTVAEVVIDFMATGWKDDTTLGSAPSYTPTVGPDGLPDDIADSGGNFNGVGDPQTTQVRACVYLIPTQPTPGQPETAPAVRYQVEGLEQFTITSGGGNGTALNLGFPNKDNAVLTTRSNYARTTRPETGITSQLLFGSLDYPTGSSGRKAGPSTGITSSPGPNDPGIQVFPLIGAPVTLTQPAAHGRFGLDSAGNYQDLRPAATPTAMTFSGGVLRIKIFPGTGNTFSDTDYIQEIEVEFPRADFPVPQITRSKFGSDDTADFNASFAETNPKNAAFYSGILGVSSDGRNFDERLQCTYNGGAGAVNMQLVVRRGDVMKSVYLDPAGPAAGDIRVLAALRHVPKSFFTAFPGYANTNLPQACGAGIGGTSYRGSLAYGNATLDRNPGLWKNQPNRDGAEYQGTLVNLSFSGRARPTVPFGMTKAELSVGGALYPGDWNTGVGSIFDGPFVNVAEQGFASDPSQPYYNVYFPANRIDSTSTATITSFSPSRQVSSPVLFGSLPSGITPLSSLTSNGTQSPWQTLLFSPNPAAGSFHPGFASGGSGGPGPGARPPFTSPSDHLFLDNFWMPVVEPYAISEPFATSGKVNLNFQVVPFDYITRTTGIYGVLKALKMVALPDGRSGDYKRQDAVLPPAGTATPSWRYNVDVDAVVAGMKATRFDFNDVYRSASEVCSIFMVPAKQPNATAQTPVGPGGANALARYKNAASWWNGMTLTGDNVRESPYDQVYSRITTKSNTFAVHYRVQALKQVPAGRTSTSDWQTWDESRDHVVSEYRGSSIIERYLNPNDTSIPDFANSSNYSENLSPYYRWRTVSERMFNP